LAPTIYIVGVLSHGAEMATTVDRVEYNVFIQQIKHTLMSAGVWPTNCKFQYYTRPHDYTQTLHIKFKDPKGEWHNHLIDCPVTSYDLELAVLKTKLKVLL
jgi:hypothetical protein